MAIRVTPNAEQIPINIVGSSTFGNYPKISLEKTYNMYISDGWLVDMPGYHKVMELIATGREGRGIFRSFRKNIFIVVVDALVYQVDNNLNAQLVGTLKTSSGPVYMDENLNYQICLVDGLNAYIHNTEQAITSLVLQTNGALGSGELIPNYVCYHDGYFLFGNANSTINGSSWYFYLPDTMDVNAIAEAGFNQILTKPDYPLALVRIPGQASNVLALGKSVGEVYTHVNNPNQPYQRNQSYSIDYGCQSVETIATSDTHLAWLAINENNSPVIMVMSGQEAKRISTDGIDFLLENILHPDQSFASMFRVDGHLMYVLTFYNDEDNISIMYDFNTDKFFHLSDQNLNHFQARRFIYFNNDLFFLSLDKGNVYRLSNQYTDINEDISDGVTETDPRLRYEIQRIRICKPVRLPTSMPFMTNQLVITIEQGCDNIPAVQDCIILMITEDNIRMFSEKSKSTIGNHAILPKQLVPEKAGQEDCVSRPYQGRIDLAISKDGGETFSNYVSRQLNPIGERKNILRWNKMGRANDLTPKFRFWTLGRTLVNNGMIEVTP